MKKAHFRRCIGILLVFLMTFWLTTIVGAHTISPVNGNSNTSTCNVMNWLSHLPNRVDDRVVTGLFGGYSNAGFTTDGLDELYTATGQYPGIFGADYGSGWATADDPTTLIDYSCNATLDTYWDNGGLVTVSCHYPSPGYANGGNLNTHLNNFSDLLNTGTATGARWRSYLDKTAEGLADLQDRGVTVIWRPFHEMNGNWFWWGNQDTTTFKNVWIDMYNYFTTTKGLNNLIWVYGPDFGVGNRTAYYPGSSYVDIVGLDVYDDAPDTNIFLPTAYNDMIGLNKPFAFTEIGPDTCGSFDYTKWPVALRQKFTKAMYFQTWDGQWAPQNNSNASSFINDTRNINRGEINLTSITEPVTIVYDFENSTNSWTGSNLSGGPWSVNEWYYNLGYTLKGDVNLSASNKIYTMKRAYNMNLSGNSYLKARVKHASWGNFGSGLTAILYVKTGSGYTWYDGGWQSINSSNATTLSISLAGVSNLNYVREIGVMFSAPSDAWGSTSCYVDYITAE